MAVEIWEVVKDALNYAKENPEIAYATGGAVVGGAASLFLNHGVAIMGAVVGAVLGPIAMQEMGFLAPEVLIASGIIGAGAGYKLVDNIGDRLGEHAVPVGAGLGVALANPLTRDRLGELFGRLFGGQSQSNSQSL